MKLMLALLTNHDLPRLRRLVKSILQMNPEPFFTVYPIIVVNSLDSTYYAQVKAARFPFIVVKTESNGKPGKGKNSCLDLFLKSDCDYLSRIDGDDIVYPTFLTSLKEHIQRYSNIGVLGVYPADIIEQGNQPPGHPINLTESIHAGVWGISITEQKDFPTGPGRSYLWDTDLPICPHFIILTSKEAAKHKFDENIAVAEDHLVILKLLTEHQKGNILYLSTMSSDLFVIDRTTNGSIQKKYPFISWVAEFKQMARQIIDERRSNIFEVPVVYKELLINHIEKEAWLKDFCEKNNVWQ
jgi:hypothetical protein